MTVLGERGYRSDLKRFPALRLALRYCRGPEGNLADLFTRVPPAFVAPATRVENKAEMRFLHCPCGAQHELTDRLEPCPGGCGRYFVGDRFGAFSARVPDGD